MTADVKETLDSTFTTDAVEFRVRLRCLVEGPTWAAIDSITIGAHSDDFACDSVAME